MLMWTLITKSHGTESISAEPESLFSKELSSFAKPSNLHQFTLMLNTSSILKLILIIFL